MLNLGIMGGTFNPIHVAHLLVAQEAMMECGLDEVLFIPNKIAPHRRDLEWIAPARDRFVMTCMAVNENERFKASAMELDRPQVSYTYDTVAAMRTERPSLDLTFITGADSLLRSEWYRLDDLLGLLRGFIVVSRPGAPMEELKRRLDELGLQNRGRIVTLEIPGMDISSTDIRTRVREGRPFRYMVPDPVYDYIRKNRLYVTPFAPEDDLGVSAPAAGNE